MSMPSGARDGSTLPRAIILQPNDGCLTLARALHRRGVEVHVLTSPEYSYVAASRGVEGEVLPEPVRDPEPWLEALGSLAADGGGVVLSGSDSASEWLTRHRAVLPSSLRTFESSDGVHLRLMDKLESYRIASSIGLRVPAYQHIRDRSDLAAVLPDLRFPRVLKARMGHMAKVLAGFGTVLVLTHRDLLEHAGRLFDHDIDFLLTEVIPGGEHRLEAAVTVRQADGAYTLEYGRRKIRQWPLDYGVGSLNQAAHVPATMAMNRLLLGHVGYHGIASCETKRNPRDGQLYLIEVNVRIPATFGLADACGVDGSWRLYATLAGIPLGPQPEQVDGRKCMIPFREARASWQRIRRHEASVGAVLRSWRGTRDFGVLSVRDPMPTVALVGRYLGKTLAGQGRLGRGIGAK
jgi:predicted ATP-grasp superfamily ATP-dependent carboligase